MGCYSQSVDSAAKIDRIFRETLFVLTLAEPAQLKANRKLFGSGSRVEIQKAILNNPWVELTGGILLAHRKAFETTILPAYVRAVDHFHHDLQLADDDQSILSLLQFWMQEAKLPLPIVTNNTASPRHDEDDLRRTPSSVGAELTLLSPESSARLASLRVTTVDRHRGETAVDLSLRTSDIPGRGATAPTARAERGEHYPVHLPPHFLTMVPHLRWRTRGWREAFNLLGRWDCSSSASRNIRTLLFVAHPDDESIFASRMLAETTFVVVATDGASGGHAELRRRALAHAMAVAGVRCWTQWDDFRETENYRNGYDGQNSGWTNSEQNRLAERIAEMLRRFGGVEKLVTHNYLGE